MYKILYNMYFNKFMKENRKNDNEIDWTKWAYLDKQCNKYYDLIKGRVEL